MSNFFGGMAELKGVELARAGTVITGLSRLVISTGRRIKSQTAWVIVECTLYIKVLQRTKTRSPNSLKCSKSKTWSSRELKLHQPSPFRYQQVAFSQVYSQTICEFLVNIENYSLNTVHFLLAAIYFPLSCVSISFCGVYYFTILPQLQTLANMFIFVCSF